MEHGQKAMEGRLLALSRAHDLLMQISWSNASLTHTLSDATEPFESAGAKRFYFNGPDIRITSGAVVALAMTFNELCTNTTKLGALSTPTGRVEVTWTTDQEKQRLRLAWTELGGPPVHPPTRRSFGTRMMESLGQQLNGQVELAYNSTGFVYSLDVPHRHGSLIRNRKIGDRILRRQTRPRNDLWCGSIHYRGADLGLLFIADHPDGCRSDPCFRQKPRLD